MINFKLIYKTTGPHLTSISAHLCLETFENLAFSQPAPTLPVRPGAAYSSRTSHTHTHTLLSFTSDSGSAAVALHRK